MDNRVLQHYRISGWAGTRNGNFSEKEMEISQKFLGFFLEIDFYMNYNIASALAHGLSLGSYHIVIRKNFDPLWSKLSQATTSRKRLP